jgi:hypothetical protein
MDRDVMYPRVIRASCPHPACQLKLFKFVPDKFVQEHDAEGMFTDGTIKSFLTDLRRPALLFPCRKSKQKDTPLLRPSAHCARYYFSEAYQVRTKSASCLRCALRPSMALA